MELPPCCGGRRGVVLISYGMVWYGMVWYRIVQYSTVQYSTVRWDVVRLFDYFLSFFYL